MNKKKLKRVLIMAGGTGGHVFPGLALAEYLRNQEVEVHWLGTTKGLEATVVPNARIPLHIIQIQGLRGKEIQRLMSAPFQMIKALLQAASIIRRVKPDVVIGMGGFVSGPGGLASWLARCPLIIHEQNAKAGLTNRVLARFANQVIQGFPNTFKRLDAICLGNPVRFSIENLPKPTERMNQNHKPLHLLVLGGSLGAEALNKLVPEGLALLSDDEKPIVWHQTGNKQFEMTKQSYQSHDIHANVMPFIHEMNEAYAWADIVICRAGALTVAELCAVGLGAILVPFPFAVDDHQTANAEFMVKHGAAICEQQTGLTAARLAAIVKEFIDVPEKKLVMAEAAYRLRHPGVAQKIFHICQEICH